MGWTRGLGLVVALVGFHSQVVLASPTARSQQSSAPISVFVGDDGEISVLLLGETWLESLYVTVHSEETLSTRDGSLQMLGSPNRASGANNFGKFDSTSMTYLVNEKRFMTTVLDYTEYGQPFLIFQQSFPDGLPFTRTNDDIDVASNQVLASFPSFTATNTLDDRGYMMYYNQMVGGMSDGTKFGTFPPDNLVGGPMAGPLVMFNRPGDMVLVLSPCSEFLSTNFVQNSDTKAVEFGPLGSFHEIPAGFEVSVMVFAGTTKGIVNTIRDFGTVLRSVYKKQLVTEDLTTKYLGYSTDNGAYYYYNTPNNRTFESELIALSKSLKAARVPVQYILLDSWWYYRGATGGVSNWTATPSAFPHGLAYFYNATSWPVQAHNRYWDREAVYAKQNGGNFSFILENNYSIPYDQSFWNMLMNSGNSWGLTVYEQDWLHNEWELLHVTRDTVNVANTWLTQMANAAKTAGKTIQYCMAYPRFALASIQFEAVSQIRASDDYYVDLKQIYDPPANLMIGVSSLLSDALGLRPSKDVFWTTAMQPGSKYGDVTAINIEAHALVATYSTGPVAFGDAIGKSNITLIMQSVTQNGTILAPSRPMVVIDDSILSRAFNDTITDGEVWFSSTDIGGSMPLLWYDVLALNLKSPYALTRNSIGLAQDTATRLICQHVPTSPRKPTNSTKTTTSSCQSFFNPFQMQPTKLPDYTLLHVMPQVSVSRKLGGVAQWGLFGETRKWVPVSPRRVLDVDIGTGQIDVVVAGSVGEIILWRFVEVDEGLAGDEHNVVDVVCMFHSDKAVVGLHETVDGGWDAFCG